MFGQAAMVIHGGEGKMLFGEAIFRLQIQTVDYNIILNSFIHG